MLRCAIAGPGPATLATWSRWSHTATKRARPSPHSAPARSAPKAQDRRLQHPTTAPSMPRQKPVLGPSLNSSKGTKSKERRLPSQNSDVLNYAVLLPAPVEVRPARRLLDSLDMAIKVGDIDKAAMVFSEMSDWRVVEHIPPEQWSEISALFEDHLDRSQAGRSIARTYDRRPELYGSLAAMAVQAAARDYWKGLHTLFLALLSAGRPQQIVNAYGQYRDRLSHIQGKNQKHLHSYDRRLRLAARVHGQGVKPLTTINIAALSMLNQLDAANVIAMFGSTSDWREVDEDAKYSVRRILNRSPNSRQLLQNYEKAIDRFQFAILIHHPQAFLEMLQSNLSRNNVVWLNELYQTLLDNSMGPNRLVALMDLDSRGTADPGHGINVPFEIWPIFIKAFQRFAQPQKIRELIEVHLPARRIVPTPRILAIAVLALAKVAKAPGQHHGAVNIAEQAMEYLLKEIHDRDLQFTDDIYAMNIELKYILNDHQFILDLYHSLGERPSRVGPSTRSSFVYTLLCMQKVQEASKVLLWTFGDPKVVLPKSDLPYRRFLQTCIRDHKHLKHHARAIQIAFRRKPDDIILLRQTKALLAVLKLTVEGEASFSEVIQSLLGLMTERDLKHYNPWRVIITTLMTHNHIRHSTTDLEAIAGLRILQAFIKHASGTLTIVRAQRLWIDYLRGVTKSKIIPLAGRRKYQNAALDILAGPPYNAFTPAMYFSLAEFNLTRRRLHREKDNPNLPPARDDDVQEAFYWWRRMRGVQVQVLTDGSEVEIEETPRHGGWWSKFVQALSRSGRQDLAVSVVVDAWESVRLHRSSTFFRTHQALLELGGITKDMVLAARGEGPLASRLGGGIEDVESTDDAQGESLDAIEEALASEEEGEGILTDQDDEVDLHRIVQ